MAPAYSCGNVCKPEQTCFDSFGGECVCPNGKELCGDTCVDVYGSDVNNCGGCLLLSDLHHCGRIVCAFSV